MPKTRAEREAAQRKAAAASLSAAEIRFEKNPKLIQQRIEWQKRQFNRLMESGPYASAAEQEQVRKTMITAELEAAAKRLEAHRARQL